MNLLRKIFLTTVLSGAALAVPTAAFAGVGPTTPPPPTPCVGMQCHTTPPPPPPPCVPSHENNWCKPVTPPTTPPPGNHDHGKGDQGKGNGKGDNGCYGDNDHQNWWNQKDKDCTPACLPIGPVSWDGHYTVVPWGWDFCKPAPKPHYCVDRTIPFSFKHGSTWLKESWGGPALFDGQWASYNGHLYEIVNVQPLFKFQVELNGHAPVVTNNGPSIWDGSATLLCGVPHI